MIARSKFMYSICKKGGEGYLRRSGKGWTNDPYKARWYAYFRYAQDKRDDLVRLGEDKDGLYFNKRYRNEEICKAGGQNHR
jgi:hypothetical protein